MNKKQRTSVDKQERLLSELYRFSEGIKENKNNHRYKPKGATEYKTIHLESVGNSLENIMNIFGYKVTSID